MTLPRHADQKGRGLTWTDFLQAAALERGAWGPLVGTASFDAMQLGEDSRGGIQDFDSVGHAVGGLLQNEAQQIAAGS
jgi:hypothetical protein